MNTAVWSVAADSQKINTAVESASKYHDKLVTDTKPRRHSSELSRSRISIKLLQQTTRNLAGFESASNYHNKGVTDTKHRSHSSQLSGSRVRIKLPQQTIVTDTQNASHSPKVSRFRASNRLVTENKLSFSTSNKVA